MPSYNDQKVERRHVAGGFETQQDHGFRGGLHHRGINGLGRASLECRLIETHEVEILEAAGDRACALGKDLGAVGLHLVGEHVGAAHEDAAVPVVAALRQKRFSPREVRFLAELGHCKSAAIMGCAAFDVAVAGLG